MGAFLGSCMLVAGISYFLGCFNGAVIVSKYILKDDIRTHGSGNAGLTNFYRTFGGPLTFAVILTDVLKAVFAVLIGSWLFVHFQMETALFGKYFAGLFCLIGHMFPFMFHFKGGKGILSGGVVAIMIDWRLALIVWGGFLLLTALTRYVSLGSIYAAAAFPVVTWFIFPDAVITALAAGIGGLVVYMHRANIRRLLRGEENKFSFHHKK
jgi:glycerol-3-phosphate acyltransferase PlsY